MGQTRREGRLTRRSECYLPPNRLLRIRLLYRNNMTQAARTFLQLLGSNEEIPTRPDFQFEPLGSPANEQGATDCSKSSPDVRSGFHASMRDFRSLIATGSNALQLHVSTKGAPPRSVRICRLANSGNSGDLAERSLAKTEQGRHDVLFRTCEYRFAVYLPADSIRSQRDPQTKLSHFQRLLPGGGRGRCPS